MAAEYYNGIHAKGQGENATENLLHLWWFYYIIALFGQSQNGALFGIRMRALCDGAP